MLLRRVVRTQLNRLLHDLLFYLFQKKVRLLQFFLLLWIFKGATETLHLGLGLGLGLGSLLVEFRLARESSPTKRLSLCGARDTC